MIHAPATLARSRPAAETGRLAVAGVAFFLSGAAALVYQVAWQRILALHSGVGMYSITVIVAAFMAGLGAGSHLGGLLSPRSGPRRALLVFASLELLIAAFGAASCRLYYDWLYLGTSGLYRSPLRAGLLHFAALVVPTALMGMSLPFLVRGLVVRAAGAGRTIGFLYGINVLGASLGALATPWLLIRLLGIEGAVSAAALGNFAAGLLALTLLHSRAGGVVDATPSAEARARPADAARTPFAGWLLLYALSGFCALSLEILWFRMVDVAVKSLAFTFGTVLSIFLFGLAAGSLLGLPLLPRVRRPLLAFVLCQCAIVAWAGLVPLAAVWLPSDLPGLAWYHDYWHGYESFRLGRDTDWSAFFKLYLLLPLVLYGPPTVLMGLSYPILQHAVQDDPVTSGRKVGFLQAANILGCTLGSLLVGLVGLNWLGTAGSLRALVLVGAVFAAVGLRAYGARRELLAALGGLLLLAALLPDQAALWRRLHGRFDGRSLYDEDATGVGALTATRADAASWNLSFNGKPQASLPFQEGHVVMGALAAVVHPAPRDVAVIGLGTAGTAWAAACRSETRSVTVFELSGSQPRLLGRVLALHEFPELRGLLADPRFVLRIADGRNTLEQEGRLYDVIEQDPILPDRAFSGNLYSREFFRRVAARLRPGGIFLTWSPTSRVHAGLHAAFPHLVGTPNRAWILASREPIVVDRSAWLARLDAARAHLGPGAENVRRRLLRLTPLPPPPEGVAANDDLFPRDEFGTPD